MAESQFPSLEKNYRLGHYLCDRDIGELPEQMTSKPMVALVAKCPPQVLGGGESLAMKVSRVEGRKMEELLPDFDPIRLA
jgi:hypothetical protein